MDKDAAFYNDRDRLPPLNALRNFEAVARHGSFAGAAGLHVSHWAVGKQIRLLENWFGVPLFERRARGVLLTDQGAALLNDLTSAFERLASGAARLRHSEFAQRVSGIVRVNMPASFALYWLLPRLADFQALFPDIDVRVSTTSRKLRYIGDAFDIGIRCGPEQGAGVVSRTLMADLRLPACSPALLRQRPIESVKDPRHQTLLSFRQYAHGLGALAPRGRCARPAGCPSSSVRPCEPAACCRRGGVGCHTGIVAANRTRHCRTPPGMSDCRADVACTRLRASAQCRSRRR
jgi:DNA-binding transcriptional LysR family regulator